jgi:nuclear transport factor 2 (NTF2) superfamily protein
MQRPLRPPFDEATASPKVRMAEDGCNGPDPAKVALAYSPDGRGRNRAPFLQARQAIQAFPMRKWQRELG